MNIKDVLDLLTIAIQTQEINNKELKRNILDSLLACLTELVQYFWVSNQKNC
jgi:hypothetical protein